MNFVVLGVLLLFLLCEASLSSWTEEGCFKDEQVVFLWRKNHSSEIEFTCSVPEENNNCSTTNLLEFVNTTGSSLIPDLRVYKCKLDTLIAVKKTFKNVSLLDISYSEYGSDRLFANKTINELFDEKLMNFTATNNNITYIPEMVYDKMTNIKMLDFSYNNVVKINTTTFRKAKGLTDLSLYKNNVTTMEHAAFADLTKLQIIDLQNNSIQRVSRFIKNNPSLTLVRLQGNPIERVDCNIFGPLNNLKANVTISSENVTLMDITCIKESLTSRMDNDTKIAGTDFGRIEINLNQESFKDCHTIFMKSNQTKKFQDMLNYRGSIPLKRLDSRPSNATEFNFSYINTMLELTVLNLTSNRLTKMTNLDELKKLKLVEINLRDNRIENILSIVPYLNVTSTETLIFSGNHIGTINASTFQRLQNLKRLGLSQTDLQFDGNPFQHLHLIDLDLSHNKLRDVQFAELSKKLQKLEVLNIAYLALEKVIDVLKYVGPSILKLDFSGNFIGPLKMSTFEEQKFSNLSGLTLSNTGLSFPEANPFESLSQLRELDISYNNFENMEFMKLKTTLKALRVLNVAGCQIKDTREVLDLLDSSVISLDISSQKLHEGLNKDTLNRFKETLQRIYLSNTSLTTFNISMFIPYKELRLINISHNGLTNFTVTEQMETLNVLDLRGNKLVDVQQLSRQYFPNLVQLGIGDNSLECDFM